MTKKDDIPVLGNIFQSYRFFNNLPKKIQSSYKTITDRVIKKNNIMMITSANTDYFPLFEVMNMALSLAKSNEAVLLVNLIEEKKHAFDSVYSCIDSEGIGEIIDAGTPLQSVVVPFFEDNRIFLLTRGNYPYNIDDVVRSDFLNQLIINYRKKYDYIFFLADNKTYFKLLPNLERNVESFLIFHREDDEIVSISPEQHEQMKKIMDQPAKDIGTIIVEKYSANLDWAKIEGSKTFKISVFLLILFGVTAIYILPRFIINKSSLFLSSDKSKIEKKVDQKTNDSVSKKVKEPPKTAKTETKSEEATLIKTESPVEGKNSETIEKTSKTEVAYMPYSLQIGSYLRKEQALKEKNSIQKKIVETDVSIFISKINIKQYKNSYYRIYLGNFTDKSKANAVKDKYISKQIIRKDSYIQTLPYSVFYELDRSITDDDKEFFIQLGYSIYHIDAEKEGSSSFWAGAFIDVNSANELLEESKSFYPNSSVKKRSQTR